MEDKLIQEQAAPTPGEGPDCWLLVIKDMEARRQFGIERYGHPVRPDNGRDALMDAYQEALDLTVYLRQEIEREITKRRLDELRDRAVGLRDANRATLIEAEQTQILSVTEEDGEPD